MGSVNTVMYLDPNIPRNDPKRIYSFLLSVIIFIFILLPPSLLMIIFPTRLFNKVSQYLKPRWIVSIRIFVDTFNGCYKDGTDGTRDYRAVSGYILATCLLLPSLQILFTLQHLEQFNPSVYITLFIVFTVLFAAMRPYKHTAANVSGVALLAADVFNPTIFISQKICFYYDDCDPGTPTLCVLQLPCVGKTTLPLHLARERAQSAIVQGFKCCTLVISK